MLVFTVGHSNRELGKFLDILRGFRIELLVDIRHYPGSRKYPHFNREFLAAELPLVGIRYLHCLALGGRRKVDKDSPNLGWHEPSFRGYADYALTEPFTEAVREFVRISRKQRTAIMCAEAVYWRCHRRIVTDYLIARGVEVRHILAENRADLATMTPFAQVVSKEKILYPAESDP